MKCLDLREKYWANVELATMDIHCGKGSIIKQGLNQLILG